MNKKFYQLFWFSLFAKILIAYFLPLVADESYYWIWSKNVRLSYFDHPAMVGWLTSLSGFLEAYGHLVRLPVLLAGHAGLYFWTKAFEKDLGENCFEFLLLLLLCPLTGVGAILIVPDTPFLFFSGLSVYLFTLALQENKKWQYALFGAGLGLGFCSKYHIVFVALSLVIFLFSSKSFKKVSITNVAIAFFSFFIAASPVFVWNYQNDWSSFRFQLNHGLGSTERDWRWPVEYLVGQAFIIFPTIIYFFVRKSEFSNKERSSLKDLAYILAIVPLLFFFYSSFKKPVEPNWTVGALPGLFAFVLTRKPSRWILRSQNYFYGAFVGLLLASWIFGFAGRINTKLAEPLLTERLKELPKQYSPLYAINYQLASQTWYGSKIKTLKLKNASRLDFFDLLDGNQPSGDFYVLKYDWSDWPEWFLRENYRIEQVLDLQNELKLLHCTQ